MKKQIPSTFILNANDVSYFFVEGENKSFGPIYSVYYNTKERPVRYDAKNFVDVHGLNAKLPISEFTKQALLDLTVIRGNNVDVDKVYKVFLQVHQLVKTQNIKKPKLGKLKSDFIDAVASYNEMKELLPNAVEISYIDDYELVTVKEKVKTKELETIVINERKSVKQIVNGFENEKGKQRTLKYD